MATPTTATTRAGAVVTGHPAWPALKSGVETVRRWQVRNGSVDLTAHGVPPVEELRDEVDSVIDALHRLTPLIPHDAAYHRALGADLGRWADGGFGVPDFLDSLTAFAPARDREDGREHVMLFPMRTASADHLLEAVALRLVWPPWLADLERTSFANPIFVPAAFEDHTPGYAGNCVALFPETVTVRAAPERFLWGGLFCDREAARFRRVATRAAQVLGLDLPADAARLLADQRRAEQTFAAWDLIHDREHGRGPLPFDPFMVKQRAPFWMYGLEELRCDLGAFEAALRLEADSDDPELRETARQIRYAVLFDRVFRFPVTNARERNYDSLAGQLLFAQLRRHGVARWADNTLSLDWDRIPAAVAELRGDIERLYERAVDRPRLVHWQAAHDLVAQLLPPHPGSAWAANGGTALDFTLPPRQLVDHVLPDEFPLSLFHENLAKQLREAIAQSRGLTGNDSDRVTPADR